MGTKWEPNGNKMGTNCRYLTCAHEFLLHMLSKCKYRIYIWSCRYDHLYKVRLQIAGITRQTFVEMALTILFFVINSGRIRIITEKSLQLLLWHYQLWNIVWCYIIRQYCNIISAGLLWNQIPYLDLRTIHFIKNVLLLLNVLSLKQSINSDNKMTFLMWWMFEFPDLYQLHSIYFHVLNRTLSTVLFHKSFSVDKMHAVGLVVNFIIWVSAYSWLLVPTEHSSIN